MEFRSFPGLNMYRQNNGALWWMHVRWCRFRLCGGFPRINHMCCLPPDVFAWTFRIWPQLLTILHQFTAGQQRSQANQIYANLILCFTVASVVGIRIIDLSGVIFQYCITSLIWFWFRHFTRFYASPAVCVATKPIRSILVLHATVPRRTTNDVISWSVVAAQVQHRGCCLFVFTT